MMSVMLNFRQFCRCSLLVIFLLFSSLSLAADFFVEMIIFRHGLTKQDLPQIAPEEWNAGADPLELVDTTYEMRKMADKIVKSGNYQLLAHKAFNYSFQSLPQSAFFINGKESYKRSPLEAKIMFSFANRVDAKFSIYLNEFDVYGLIFRSEAILQTKTMNPGRVYYVDQDNLGMLVKVRKYGS